MDLVQVIDCTINGFRGPDTRLREHTERLRCQQICFPGQTSSDGDGGGPYDIPEKDQLYLSATGVPAGRTLALRCQGSTTR